MRDEYFQDHIGKLSRIVSQAEQGSGRDCLLGWVTHSESWFEKENVGFMLGLQAEEEGSWRGWAGGLGAWHTSTVSSWHVTGPSGDVLIQRSRASGSLPTVLYPRQKRWPDKTV